MSDWKQTPTLDAFAKMYDEDEHLWWRIGCGHHQNLYEAAVERYEQAEAAIARVRELCESAITDYHRQAATKNVVARAEMARRVLRALDGVPND